MIAAREAEPAPPLAMPPRPARPLSTLGLLRTFTANSLAACDDELFEELVVERRFLWRRVFIVSDPAGIRHVLQDNSDNYLRVPPVRRAFEFSANGGMVCIEGGAWRHHRRIINPALDHRALRPDVPELIRLTELMVQHLSRLPPDRAVEIGRTLTHLLTRTTGQVFAGDEPEIDAMLLRMGRYPEQYGLFDLLPLPRWLRFVDRLRKSRAGTEQYYTLIDRLVGERLSPGYAGGEDLLWRLATSRDRQTGEKLSLAEIRDEVLTLASTAATPLRPLTWIWYLLALHPRVEATLHAELDGVLGGETPSASDIPRLVYLRQVVDETMRLYPALPLTLRSAAGNDTICGRHVPRNSIVAVAPWVVHRHKRLWRNPERFDPDRFSSERAGERPRDAYIPFGVGPHVCPGAALSMTEILITAAILAQRFRFRLAPGPRIEPVAWTTLRPRTGIMMTIEPRVPPTQPR
ncbi:MAG TPA: cytochrome P450 [Stellaceae bacterium]|jgi:cytochrome P450|nr:cytochrome P450 [Stellaceae bacterium]